MYLRFVKSAINSFYITMAKRNRDMLFTLNSDEYVDQDLREIVDRSEKLKLTYQR